MNLLSNKARKICPFLSCAVASEIILFHGKEGLTQERFDSLWRYDNYPPALSTVNRLVKMPNIKWYIRNCIEISDPIWNGDYLRGIMQSGKVNWGRRSYPTIKWNDQPHMLNVVKDSPFYGNVSETNNRFYRWYNVPALYLPYSENKISFMAGVLSTGKIKERRGELYAHYSKGAYPFLKRWGIPIEFESANQAHNLVSPLWPALFARYMTEGDRWLQIKNGGFNSHLYSAILWRMYVSNNIVKNGLPYLKSRKWVYNHYGKIEDTEMKWLEMGLSQLDWKVRSVVSELSKSFV